jgi:hypothetical protein
MLIALHQINTSYSPAATHQKDFQVPQNKNNATVKVI